MSSSPTTAPFLAQQVQTSTSFYQVLGVDVNATPDQINSAYRQRCLILHPDRNTNTDNGAPSSKEDLHSAFHKVSEAHDTLGDTRKRALYDSLLNGSGTNIADMDRMEKLMTAAKCFSTLVATDLLSNSKQRKMCQYPGCSNTGLMPGEVYCAKCYELTRPKCHQCCTFVVSQIGDLCPSCRDTGLAKKGKCRNLGCFYALATTEEISRGVCDKCHFKPKKCQQLGCFKMTTDPTQKCEEHRKEKKSLLDGL